MRSTLRSLTFGLAATLAGACLAQQNTWVINGVVSGCYAGQQVTLTIIDGNTQTILITENATINPPDCSFGTVAYFNSTYVLLSVVTQCNGVVVGANDSAFFSFFPDTAFTSLTLNCGGLGEDCTGEIGGPNMPGTPCDDGNPATIDDLWSPFCICAGQDTSAYYDCLGELNGPNVAGTPCTDFFGNVGVWNLACDCITNSQVDCLGEPNGPNVPGAACDDNDSLTVFTYWNADCECVSDSSNYDCLGELNGPNVPGTPCTAFGVVGTWNAQCMCVPDNPEPCEASFWVLQAYGQDSLPIPFELWVWNLSSGGNGVFTYLWDFGDGTTSTDAFPTHTYADNGPYVLCLTIADNGGCTSTYCDTVSINGDGIYEGMVGNGGDRSEGFTLNVQNPLANAVGEVTPTGSIATWPNPSVDELNVAVVSGMTGAVEVTITDLDGRVVVSERMSFSGGRKQLSLSTSELGAGMYLLRISDGATSLSQRFVKAN